MLAFASTAYADSYNPATQTVIIDTPWASGTLQTVVETSLGANPANIEILTITEGNLNSVDSAYINNNMVSLRELRITGNGGFTITTSFFFASHAAIEYIEIPCTEIRRNFASNCPNLHTVILPNATDFLGISTLISNPNLTTLTTPLLETVAASSLWGNTSLATLSMPNLITVGNACLTLNSSLTTVYMPLAQTFGNGAFRNNDALTSLSLPSAISFGDDSISGNLLLTSIDIPDATTFLDRCLRNNDALISLSAPSATTFGNNAINGNALLQSVNLPVVTTFGIRAFQNSDALTSVYMPMLETIGDFAFNGSTNLITIELDATTPSTLSPTAFTAYNPAAYNSVVQVPINQVDDYDAADGIPTDGLWYGWIIEGIEPAAVINPQTSDSGIYIPYTLIIGLLIGACLLYGFIEMRKARE